MYAKVIFIDHCTPLRHQKWFIAPDISMKTYMDSSLVGNFENLRFFKFIIIQLFENFDFFIFLIFACPGPKPGDLKDRFWRILAWNWWSSHANIVSETHANVRQGNFYWSLYATAPQKMIYCSRYIHENLHGFQSGWKFWKPQILQIHQYPTFGKF